MSNAHKIIEGNLSESTKPRVTSATYEHEVGMQRNLLNEKHKVWTRLDKAVGKSNIPKEPQH